MHAPPLSCYCSPRSTAHVKREEVALYLAFQGRRFSLEISFRHALPPRHLRLAWPDVETFDILLPKVVQGHGMSVPPFLWNNGTTPGVATERAVLGTSLAVCAMFKNEAPYLEEWLQYHRLLGVSKVCSSYIGMSCHAQRNTRTAGTLDIDASSSVVYHIEDVSPKQTRLG